MSNDLIPDGISFADLEKLQEKAVLDNHIEEPEYDGLTAEEVHALADRGLELISEGCEHPIAHKVAAMVVLNNMLEWHKRMAEACQEAGEFPAANGWSRDAGKFQACLNILTTVEVGEGDFTCPE